MAGTPESCPHAGLYWYAAPANERGWKCVDCGWQPGEPSGFSPKHDRDLIGIKVGCILNDLHEAQIIYVSNGSAGDSITGLVVQRCRRTHSYDSVSIAKFILTIEGDERHAKFWREISDGILAGKDPRPRCACGQLATQWTLADGREFRACSYEHMQAVRGGDPKEPF